MGLIDLFRWKRRSERPQANAVEQTVVLGRSTCGRVLFLGGPGETVDEPVLIRGAPSQGAGIRAEYEYLIQRYGQPGSDWTLEHQMLLRSSVDNRPIDEMLVRLGDGRLRFVYFDLSECFDKRCARSSA